MAFNLKNRSFLKEIDFQPRELSYLLKLSEALKLAKYAGTEVKRLEGKEIALIAGLGHARARLRLPACIRATLSRPCRRREVVGKRGERVRL
jgi:ornithine carbamoyltransferase